MVEQGNIINASTGQIEIKSNKEGDVVAFVLMS